MRLDEQIMGDEAGLDQQAFHQMMLERQEMRYEALEKLAKGIGGEKEINLLADELKVPSPINRKGKA